MNHNIITRCACSGCGSVYIADCNDFKTIYEVYLSPRGWIQYTEPSADDPNKLAFFYFCSDKCKESYLSWQKIWRDEEEDSKLKKECKCDRCNGLGYIEQEYLNKKEKLSSSDKIDNLADFYSWGE